MWYVQPGWWALGLSVLSLAVSAFALRCTRRATRVSVEQRLLERAASINEGFLRYQVAGPYATQLNIPPAEVEEFSKKAVMLLHQLNLLREVFVHSDILGQETVEAYQVWGRRILNPWIERDPHLQKTLRLFRESEDLVGKKFLDWLSRTPAHAEHASPQG